MDYKKATGIESEQELGIPPTDKEVGGSTSNYITHWAAGGDKTPQTAKAKTSTYSHEEVMGMTYKGINPMK